MSNNSKRPAPDALHGERMQAEGVEKERTASVQTHTEKNNRSIDDVQFTHRPTYSKAEAERRRREARHRIERTRQQRQAARYFCNMQGVVRRV